MLAIKRSLVCAVCAVCTLALSGTGCYRPLGPQSVARDRRLYATSLSDSWKEQTLLNIGKIRYFDPPLFVDVGNIVANYSLQTGVTASGNIVPGGTSAATIGGFGTYTNTPTITYSRSPAPSSFERSPRHYLPKRFFPALRPDWRRM
jgi:hypothetical protein